MQWLKTITSWLLLGSMLLAEAAPTPADTDPVDALQAAGMQKLQAWMETESAADPVSRKRSNKCSLLNVAVRREWSSLSKAERKCYIDAVLCLQSKPAKSSYAGARSRYDDFVGVHIEQTLSIHGTANFLTWHRYFTWTFEQALRNECGYTGHQPYWNWGRTANSLLTSAMFDGSSTSMSGDGAYVPHDAYSVGGGQMTLPPANGGGCVTSGPFKNMTVNLGPVAAVLSGVTANPSADGLGYNPRCLKRDLNPAAAAWTTTAETVALITGQQTLGGFQTRMQGDFANGFLGVHSGGHFSIGGDPGGDLFASPADPAFFLHHGMIDRVWWIWQMLDLKNRVNTVAGTITINDLPPSRNGTLEDLVDMGVNNQPGGAVKLGTLTSTVAGPFCYVYL
ncbi:tyrosinase central domain-containing protein [Geopyxis carbonaria]|nr:tyrosinase central domain-containing protein [Geopyxis carbonaria]